MKVFHKGAKIPSAKATPEIPDADGTAAKAASAEAKNRERRRGAAGSMNKTLATSPQGTLGAAPTSTPTLKSNLG